MTAELKRIAYVEDEPDIREVTQMTLSELCGFDLDVSRDGQEALERIPAFRPDLMLLDVMMPGLTGPELLPQLRAFPDLAETPVVFMTAKAQTHEVQSYLKMGAAGVIVKPYDPMTLGPRLQDIWEEARRGTGR